MSIRTRNTPIPNVVVVETDVYEDQRGFFTEVYRQDQFAEARLPEHFVQLNHSGSIKGVIRGLHFQWEPPMGKLMRVTRGRAFLVAVDLRKGSPTLGQWYGIEASESNRLQVWAPAAFARGFCALSELAEVQYLCTGVYNSRAESGILWNDPQIGIDWPVKNPTVSDKDRSAQTLSQWLSRSESDFFRY